ncbi:hypothetical protein A3D03_00970 [Candidatus Gottesmanbacteria bacterium RIFCSPHIGHO2_02_FULL_40_13]|uniref:Uncharacterized protein n=1 Tax=Candidatus Gottesmanbacteria bacterium RIFCSPHIGHO2_02_FULL_40_13 TaxID=1798384 RepID=A0A1F6A5C3_9BACT|nr:MAG: hypothetical protein A3D03_00970 [Candidatus Gottesmanbacteria bacterium RIFCSPHIGHO2_02_FULL_40_13]
MTIVKISGDSLQKKLDKIYPLIAGLKEISWTKILFWAGGIVGNLCAGANGPILVDAGINISDIIILSKK